MPSLFKSEFQPIAVHYQSEQRILSGWNYKLRSRACVDCDKPGWAGQQTCSAFGAMTARMPSSEW